MIFFESGKIASFADAAGIFLILLAFEGSESHAIDFPSSSLVGGYMDTVKWPIRYSDRRWVYVSSAGQRVPMRLSMLIF